MKIQDINPSIVALVELKMLSISDKKLPDTSIVISQDEVEELKSRILSQYSEGHGFRLIPQILSTKMEFVIEFTDFFYKNLSQGALILYGAIKHEYTNINNDTIVFRVQEYANKISSTTRACHYYLKELLDNQVLFKKSKRNEYFINVCFFAKGSMEKIIANSLNLEYKSGNNHKLFEHIVSHIKSVKNDLATIRPPQQT